MLKYYLLLLLFLGAHFSFAQSDRKKELEKQKNALQKEIKYVNNLLNENKKAAKFSLSELRNLNLKINIRQDLINNYNKEIDLLESRVKQKNSELSDLQTELDILKKEYAQLIVQSYKSRSASNRIMFLLSAENFNQALKRLRYMDQVGQYRLQQARKIADTQEKITKTISLLEDEKLSKMNLVSLKELEKGALVDESQQKANVVSALQKENKKLEKEILAKQQKSEALQVEIQKIIAEEIRIAREKANSENKSKNYSLTAEAKLLADNFTQNKNKLPWPVEKGVVVSRYGKHSHPTLKNIEIVNHGVDIATEKGQMARSVFKGEVISIIISRGGSKTVIVQHGNFYTVYSNLSQISVSKGQKLETKDDIGEIYFDPRTGDSILKFQLWQDKSEQNPSDWIYKM